MVQPQWKRVRRFLKKKIRITTYIPKRIKRKKRYLYTQVHSSTASNSPKVEATSIH